MSDFKVVKRFDLELGDNSSSMTEDLLTRKTTEFLKGEPVSETIEYSSSLEAFIRQIVREEIEKAATVLVKTMHQGGVL